MFRCRNLHERSCASALICSVEVNRSGLLTDHRVLFQSGMLTFQITSPSILWAPKRRMKTLMIGQKVRRDFFKEKSNRIRCVRSSRVHEQ